MLYFFNLVNVKFQKELDAAIKGKVNPNLIPKTLWWFRWGAVVTWVTGFLYYILIVGTENPPGHKILVFLARLGRSPSSSSGLYRGSPSPGGPLKDGRVLAVAIAVVVLFDLLAGRGATAGAAAFEPPHDLDPDRRRDRARSCS